MNAGRRAQEEKTKTLSKEKHTFEFESQCFEYHVLISTVFMYRIILIIKTHVRNPVINLLPSVQLILAP